MEIEDLVSKFVTGGAGESKKGADADSVPSETTDEQTSFVE